MEFMTGAGSDGPDVEAFRAEGCVRLRGLHPKPTLQAVRKRVLDELARLRLWGAGKGAARALEKMTAFQQTARLSSMVQVPGLQDALLTPEVRGVIAGLSGMPANAPADTQLLLSLPHRRGEAEQPLNWHVDLKSASARECPGVQVFYLIDDVRPGGGATLALARSHRLSGDAARKLRAALKSGPGLDAAARDSGTEVIEMSGAAGDVYFMDMRVLHSPSFNASTGLRMMATTRMGRPGT